MGLDYSFEIIARRAATVPLVEALAVHLVPDDATRLLSAVTAFPDQPIANARRGDLEEDDLCLTFLFVPDQHIIDFGGNNRLSDAVTGRIAIGCVWSEILCGDRFVMFRGTAATAGMSRLFEVSPSIRATFTRIGCESGALLVAFDDEQGELIGLWPRYGRIGACVLEDAITNKDGAYKLRVDPYCEAVMRAFDHGPPQPGG